MSKVLILTGRYLPGYKDGGPVRTIKNLTDLLGDKYEFTVACADRDHGDSEPYKDISKGLNKVGRANVFYVENGKYTFSIIKKLASENDLIYVCGPYNGYAIKALLLKRLGIIKCPLVLAPMGSFSKGAMAIKSTKKKLFFSVIKFLGFFNNIYFSVTSDVERTELNEAIKVNNKCFIARDPQRSPEDNFRHEQCKRDGKLSIVFLSRICEKKNLLGCIGILEQVNADVVFDIYGNIEDKEYYEKCIERLKKLPPNIEWNYKGIADSEEVPKVLSRYDVFLFPTHGENFGHVISEALSAGAIPVISDTTPWLDFKEHNAGYVVKHDDTCEFAKIINSLADMSEEDIKIISDNAVSYYRNNYEDSIRENGYLEIFNELI